MIQPRPNTIGEILTLSKHFVVPPYQRGYAWEIDEAEEFFTDLEMESEFGRGLFLGTLIFNVAEESQDRITIVDGQQRLTTIFILLIACRVLAKELKEEGIAHETQKRITFTNPATAESEGSLLVASGSIREIFNHMTETEWSGIFPHKVGPNRVKRQNKRVKPIFEAFRKRIKDYGRPRLSKLLDAIYKTRVIRIDIDGDEEAFNIFERTNARGMDLEVSDLLKTYLYQQKVPELDAKWDEILKNADGTILKMLKYFYVSRNDYISKSDLYPKLKDYCKKLGGAAKFVEELCQFSTFYNIARKEDNISLIKDYFDAVDCKAISGDPDKYQRIHISLQALRLFKVSQTYPLINAAIGSLVRTGGSSNRAAGKVLIKLLDILEKYHFINSAVCGRVGNEVEKLYASFCKKFCESKDFEKTTNELIGILRGKLAPEEEFTSRFCEISYDTDPLQLIAYIFDRFNNYNLAPGERVAIYDPQTGVKRKNHNVEHFLAKKSDKETKVDPATQEILDNIGNLLVISFRANSSLGNLPPSKKIQKLKGDLSRRTHNLPYLKEFVEKYGEKAESWDEHAIEDRARDMAKEAYCQVWKFT
ncbi:MAG TPA: DUF262 domain-containing HNH endonuclease family protein [Candidatus Acidoferrales bacterium]|nr:DUF262 domain-containing HNH endonuclease family protein [Candidatus Acidoferrales bacterium]